MAYLFQFTVVLVTYAMEPNVTPLFLERQNEIKELFKCLLFHEIIGSSGGRGGHEIKYTNYKY